MIPQRTSLQNDPSLEGGGTTFHSPKPGVILVGIQGGGGGSPLPPLRGLRLLQLRHRATLLPLGVRHQRNRQGAFLINIRS